MNGLYPGDQAEFTLDRFDHLPTNQRPVFIARFLTVREEHQRGRLLERAQHFAEQIIDAGHDDDARSEAITQRLDTLAELLTLCLAEVRSIPNVAKPADLLDHLATAEVMAAITQSIVATTFTQDQAKNSDSPSSSEGGGSANTAPATPPSPTATAASTNPPPPSPPSSTA